VVTTPEWKLIMSISPVSINAGLSSQGLQVSQMSSAFKQRRQDFDALASALKSGDLSGAQKAFSALQQDMQAIAQTRRGQASNSSSVTQTSQSSQSGTTSLKDLMNQLKQALSSGNLQGAQKAFAAIQQNMQANQSQGHHHHHGGGSQPSASSTVNATTSGTTPTTGISIKA
jgi:ribosomal protein S20